MRPSGRAYGPLRPLCPRGRPLRCRDADKKHPGGAEDYFNRQQKKKTARRKARGRSRRRGNTVNVKRGRERER